MPPNGSLGEVHEKDAILSQGALLHASLSRFVCLFFLLRASISSANFAPWHISLILEKTSSIYSNLQTLSSSDSERVRRERCDLALFERFLNESFVWSMVFDRERSTKSSRPIRSILSKIPQRLPFFLFFGKGIDRIFFSKNTRTNNNNNNFSSFTSSRRTTISRSSWR